MLMANAHLFKGIVLQAQMMYNDPECKDIIQMLNFMKEWNDSSLVFRYQGVQGQSIMSGTFMQSLNKQIQCGIMASLMVSNSTILTCSLTARSPELAVRVLRILHHRR